METTNQSTPGSRTSMTSATVLGGLLILVGIGFLVAQFTNVDLGQYGWPLFVVVSGVVLIALGLINRPAAGLVIPGSIVTMTGVILAIQNFTGLWASWSYAWALIFPTSIGIGTAILGLSRGNRKEVSGGVQVILAGLALFAIFGIFFEGILHVDGVNLGTVGNILLPVVLIAAGVLLLVWRLLSSANRRITTS